METIKNFIDGKWTTPSRDTYIDVENPSTGEIIARSPLSAPEDTRAAVRAAARAYPEWRTTPASRRVGYLFRFLDLVREHQESLSRTISEEMGKSLPDSRAEMKRTIENIEVACGMPVLQQGTKAVQCSSGIDGEVLRLPRGVFAMVGPFNFPAMVPFWFIPYALAAGNTYVAKPSEQVPRTMFELTQLMERAELPPGVFNLLNGDKEVSQGLMEDPEVQGISFVGSSRVCRIVSTTCSANNKRYQAMGGAKNHLVVMPDANRDKAIANMVTSCFGCAGQRCMAASAIVCVGEETYSDIVERFVSAARNIAVADPLDPAVADRAMVMGPLISARARESILSLIQDGISEGARPALDGSGFTLTSRPGGHFVGPTVLADVRPGMKVHRTEIFGPVVVMLRVNTLDEAIAVINEHEYGNGASIYTQSGYHARKFKIEALAGMIGVNVGIPAPVAYLPFGGMKESMHSDIKAQGAEVVEFFTERKIVTERYWE